MVSVQNPVGSSRVPIVPVQNPIGSICAECHRFPVFQNTQFCSKACRSGAPKCHVCAKEPCYYDWTQQQYSSCCSRTCLNIRRTKNGCRICGAVPYPGSECCSFQCLYKHRSKRLRTPNPPPSQGTVLCHLCGAIAYRGSEYCSRMCGKLDSLYSTT